MKKLIVPILILAMLLCAAAPAAAESREDGAMLLDLAEGSVTVKDAEGNLLAAEAGMVLSDGYSVGTGDDGLAGIRLGGGKTVKLDRNSAVTVWLTGHKARTDLLAGRLIFILSAPLEEDGEFLIRTERLETQVLGSSGVVTLRKVLYVTGHGNIYRADEDGGFTMLFDIRGGQLLELKDDGSEMEVTDAKVSDFPSLYLKEVEQNESLQESLKNEGNYSTDELIAEIPAAEQNEHAMRDEMGGTVAVPGTVDGEITPAFTKTSDKGVNNPEKGRFTMDLTGIVPVLPKEPDVFTVVWENGNTVLKTDNVNKGEVPEYDGETPVKAADAQYTYTFSRWDPAPAAAAADATYTAVFTEKLNQYSVTFVDEDGTELKAAAKYDYGTAAEDIARPADPEKAADAQYIYTFAGWDPAVADVTENVTYKAKYNSTVNKYTVTWKDGNGETLKTEQLAYGATPAYTGDTPAKAATAQYTYTFNNAWDPAVADVTGDATYTAQFDSTVNKYTIIWKDGNDKTLKTEQLAYGATPAYTGDTPAKTATAQYTYTFNNTWDPAVADVTGDATYTAQFGSTVNKYTITWKQDDGTVIDTTTVEYGKTPEHADPVKAADPQYTYTFAGWDPAVSGVTGNATYTATYNPTLRSYTVKFVNADKDKTVLSTDTYDYGTPAANIVKPVEPEIEPTDQYVYIFASWTPDIADVTGDATYTATYTPIPKYSISFVDEDGTELKSAVRYLSGTPAADIDKPANPTKQSDSEDYRFTFDKWDPTVSEVTGDQVYKAKYKTEYKITWKNDDDSVAEYWEEGKTPDRDLPIYPEEGARYVWYPIPYPADKAQVYEMRIEYTSIGLAGE